MEATEFNTGLIRGRYVVNTLHSSNVQLKFHYASLHRALPVRRQDQPAGLDGRLHWNTLLV
jgi:hypothetical protein